MEKIHLTTTINAPREKVWDVMLNDETYRQWTAAFNPGSYYKGSWEEGSKILFLGPSMTGEEGEGGMVSRVEKVVPHEFVSIEHLGLVSNGVEDTESDEVQQWKGLHENYTFTDVDTGTELAIDMDIPASEKESMEKAWQKALEMLKELAEK